MTAVALLHFAQVGCQVAVLEVGPGGRLTPLMSLRHQTLPLSRASASTIPIRSATPSARSLLRRLASSSREARWCRLQEPDAAEAVEAAACAAGCTVVQPDFGELDIAPVRHLDPEQIEPGKPAVIRPFTYKGNAYETTLLGSYQPQNAALALKQCSRFSVAAGISRNPPSNAALPPRAGPVVLRCCRTCRVNLTVVIDGGHNPQGAQALADSLADVFADRKAVLLSGVMADKDHPAMLRTVLPHAAAFVAVTPDNPRALPAAEYASEAVRIAAESPAIDANLPICAAQTYAEAARKAGELAGPDGIICAFGSLYSIAQTKRALREAGLLAGE